MNIILDACAVIAFFRNETGILVTSDRKEFEPIISLNICQIDFIP
jgi:hypothetical protein